MAELESKIGAVLRNKPAEVWSISPAMSVYEAIEMMAEKQVGALPVVEQGQLVGIISERDYARKVILKGRSSKDTQVAEIMTRDLVTISPQHTVGECMRIVTDKRFRHLPVMEGGRLVGIISIGDLVNWVISEQQQTIRHLEAYIRGVAS
jgi:CBS domain-containing protein